MRKIDELMQKEMTRKEFLATVGFGMASVFGLSTILGWLSDKDNPTQQNTAVGYGNGPYGGAPRS